MKNKTIIALLIAVGILASAAIVSGIIGLFIPGVITILFFTIAAFYILFAFGCIWYIIYTVIKYLRE